MTAFKKHVADDTFEAHAALIRAEEMHPTLKFNPYWAALRDTAYARFKAAMEDR